MQKIIYTQFFDKSRYFYTKGGLRLNKLTGNESIFGFSTDMFCLVYNHITMETDKNFILKVWQKFWDYRLNNFIIKPWKEPICKELKDLS